MNSLLVWLLFAVPTLLLFVLDITAQKLCELLRSTACRGIGMDGGPLEPLEWFILGLGTVIQFGIFIWLGRILYRYIRGKRLTQKQP